MFRIRQENTKITVSFPGKNNVKIKKYSKILPDFVILELTADRFAALDLTAL